MEVMLRIGEQVKVLLPKEVEDDLGWRKLADRFHFSNELHQSSLDENERREWMAALQRITPHVISVTVAGRLVTL
jgi:hypothetical protein